MARTEAEKLHERQYGGYRTDEHGKRYWLTSTEIVEFDRQNVTIEKDEDFWTWFREFREDKHIPVSWASSSSERGVVSWGGKEKTKGKYLSDWWSGTSSWFKSAESEEAGKLAIAMSAIRTVIRVIDDSNPPMMVKWAEKGMSYTDFRAGEININPKPMKDKKLEEGGAIDIATAFAMHEASHAAYTKPIWQQLLKPEPISPMTVSGLLANLVEDIRIERNTSAKFPGFIEYFEKGLRYLWDTGEVKPPPSYGPDLQSKLNFAIAAIKWPIEAEKMWRAKDPVELDWWQAWSDRFQKDKTLPLRATAQEGIDHLRLATEEEKADGKANEKGEGQAAEEMDKTSEEEKAIQKVSRSVGDFISRLERFLREKGYKIIDFCPHPEPDDGLGRAESEEVNRLVNEQFRKEHIPVKMPNGTTLAEVRVTKPMETDHSRSCYIGKPSPHIARLKAALLFRQELPQYTNRLQREGGLDEEELWRWSAGDYRLFEEKVIAVHPKVQMSLLVDMSGSMMGGGLETAEELAQLFVWALKDMQNVTTKVFGHTANIVGHDCQVYRIWEPGDPLTRLGLIHTLPHMNNYDGFAIASVAKELMDRGEPDEQRVLIVLADGYPSGAGYGGEPAFRHVKMVDDWARKNGVEVIQIAIDYSLDPGRQSAMFKQWIPFTDTGSLPRKLEALLAKLT
jgi:hypothetical protein